VTRRPVTIRPDLMQILFVSSVAAGGSGMSQRQLARRLTRRGHRVDILAATPESAVIRPVYDRLVDASTRLRGSRARPALLALQRRLGRRVHRRDTGDHPTLFAAVPENAAARLLAARRPDVVVANSIDRVSWRRLRAQLQQAGIPSVLYLREASGLGHLTLSAAPPDLLLANARSHAERAREAGYPCEVVPSVVEVAPVETTRRVVLLVNPIEILGGDRIWAIAAARPDIPFVIQESGLLDEHLRADIHDRAAQVPNVEVRPFSDRPGALFGDCRVLLVPHRVDNRPRVVLEAQASGIPVVASAQPGLVESVGPGGVIVEDTDDPAPWVRAIGEVWDDPATYDDLSAAARVHARRPEVDAELIAQRFETLLVELVESRRGGS
jgi:glycosyltransferase involved in cell wall biosynthesis